MHPDTKLKTKILVIDDDTAILSSISTYLEDSGYDVKNAENGKAGLEIFDTYAPDLVLTDLHMPVLGGLEVLNIITKKNRDSPVIVISGAGELNDAIQALRLGAWDFITKPVSDLQVLEHAINKAIERKNLVEENKIYAQHIASNLKILEEDHIAGRTVQMSLLPADHMLFHDFEFKFKIIPSLELSGDFVEYFSINESLIGVYLADVSGHGASSAFITVLLKSIISKYQVYYNVNKDDTIINPHKLMRALSDEIFAAKLNKYITLIYGILNTKTSEFCYGVGGHYPNPILTTSDGKARILEGGGFPIGIMPNVDYNSKTVLLHPGEYIIMFSDGVMEVVMPGASLTQKETSLLSAVQRSNGDLATLLDVINVASKPNIAHPDDITVITINHL